MADAQSIVQVGAEIGPLDKGMVAAGKAVDHFGDVVGKVGSKAGGFLTDAFSFATGGLIQKGIETIGGSITGFFSEGIGESQGWNAAMAQTEAVVKSTGGAAGLTAQAMGDLADSLSGANGMSMASDDAILSGEAMLATFTNIGKDVFPQATATALDMAEAFGGDASSQALSLGKALNDPIAGVGALSRVGVTFTAQQKEQIKAMVEAGDTAGAQAIILGELNKEVGGSAAAAAKADGGMFQLSEQFANVKQTVGDALLPILHDLVGFVASPAVMGTLQGLATLVGEGLTAGFGFLKDVIGQILPPIQAFGAILMQAFSGELKLDTLQALPGWLQPVGAIVGVVAENLGEFFRAIQGGADPLAALGELIKNNFLDLLPKVGDLLGGLGGVLATAFTGALDFLAQNALPAIGGALQAIGAGIAGAIDSVLAPQVSDGMGKVGGGFFDWVGTEVLPRIGEVFGTIAGAIGEWITGGGLAALVGNLARWGQALVDWIGPMIPPLLGKLGELLGSVGAWLLDPGLPTLIRTLADWGGALIGWIAKDALPFIGQKLADFGAAIWTWLTGGGLTSLIMNMQKWGQGLTNWVSKDALPFIGQKLADFGQAIWTWLTGGGLATLILNMQAWGQGLLDWIGKDALPFIGQKLMEFGQAIWTWLTSPDGLGALVRNMQAWGQGLVDWVSKDALPFIGGKLGEFAGAIWTWITETAATIGLKAATIGQGLLDGLSNTIRNGASQVVAALGGVVTGAIDNAKNLLGIHSDSDATISIGEFLIGGLVSSLTTGQEAVSGALGGIAELFHQQALPSNEGTIAAWWGGTGGLISYLTNKVDVGSNSLKAYMGPAWAGVFEYIGQEWSLQIPALEGEWTDFMHFLEQKAQSTANQIAAIMAGIPTLPGGEGPPGTAPPGGGGGGGGGGGATKNAAIFGGGAAMAAAPALAVNVYVSNGAGGWKKANPQDVMVEVDYAQRAAWGET